MKKYIVSLLFIGAVAQAEAQQLQTSSMYDLQGVFHNPSTAGVKGSSAGVSYRTQWSGISGSPRTATAFGSFDIPKMKIGIGGYLYNDKTGPTSRTGLQLAFAKHIPTGDGKGKFSVGLEARGQQYSLDRAKLTATLGADPAIGTSENRFVFDAGFGISYTDNKLQLGASVSNLVQSKLNFYTGNLSTTEAARLYRHYFFHGSYKWAVDESTTITPNFLVIYLPNAPTEFQGGVRVEHKELFFWGLSLRARQSFMLSAGLHINKKFTVGYAFDIYQTPLSVFDAGANAHEMLLKYNFSK
jgi:type IX secretion system PorP/SprF family membrane protein